MRGRSIYAVAIALAAASFVVMATGCASAKDPSYDGIPRDAVRCVKSHASCTVMHVQNDGYPEAVIYVNAQRIGEAGGLGSTTLFFDTGALGVDGCAVVTIRQIAGRSGRTSRECIRHGGYYDLYIGTLFSTSYLVPRGGE